MTNQPAMMLHPTQDERSRQAFIIQFKQKVNLDLQQDIRAYFSEAIAPELESELGEPLDDLNRDHRKAVKRSLSDQHLFQTWESLTWIGQGMMWDCIDETLGHDLPRLEAVAADVVNGNDKSYSIVTNDQ